MTAQDKSPQASEMGEIFDEWKAAKRAIRKAFAIDCPRCIEQRPRGNPSKLLPGQRCRVDHFKDQRPRTTLAERNAALAAAGLSIREQEPRP